MINLKQRVALAVLRTTLYRGGDNGALAPSRVGNSTT
jgi:hypothetical protein